MDGNNLDQETANPVDRLAGLLDGDADIREDEEVLADDDGTNREHQEPDLEADNSDGQDDEEGEVDQQLTERELEDQRLRYADYTRKTQELAKEREQLQRQAAQLDPLKNQLETALKQYLSQHQEEPDWDRLKAEDPYQYAIKAAEWSQEQAKRQNAQAQLAYLDREKAQKIEQAKMAYVQSQEQRLLEMLPAWKKPEVRERESAELVKYLTSNLGATQDEINAISTGDARILVALDKARKYDALLAKRGDVTKRVEGKPPVKPGAASTKSGRATENLQAAKNRLRKSGSLRDGAAAIANLI